MRRLDLARLPPEDLEALAALKLFEELGLGVEATTRLLSSVDEAWMRAFLGSGPSAIGRELLGPALLVRARLYRARARAAGHRLIEQGR